MYLNIENPKHFEYNVIDMNTDTIIPGVQEADDETGEFTCYLRGDNGNVIIDKDGKLIEFHFKGNIKLIKKEE